MDRQEPVELISQIRAIFYFLGGMYIPSIEDQHDISVIKVNISEDNNQKDSVNLQLIEERLNNIQGVDHNLKLMISKSLPKMLINGRKSQYEILGDREYVYITFEEFVESLRSECELLEVE